MAEEEVQYASVVVKSKKTPRAEKEQEVVYDDVKIPNQKAQQTPDTSGPLSVKEAEKCRWYQKLACSFGILCVILVLAITGVYVHFHLIESELKASNSALMVENQTLTRELDEVKNKTQQLQKQIETMEKTWNEQNVSRAQWSVDEYCPKKNNRKCRSCQKGWLLSQSSCYAVNNAEPPDQKTWKEARENCRGKISDLTVVGDEGEKKFVNDESWVNDNIKGYWIGLRAEGGKWRWIDGSDLTNQAWIQQQPADDGQCVTSLQNRGWRSESCDEKNAWICEKKALSV